jgi:hypothetical protein
MRRRLLKAPTDFGPHNPGKPFGPDNQPSRGRVKGSRNKLAAHFVADLQAEWEQHGPAIIRIVRIEKPVEFMKIIASVLPKEFEITDSMLKEIPDDQLDILLQFAEGHIGRGLDRKSSGGEEPTLN